MTELLDSAYLLHQRAYRETSVIASFLTDDGGYRQVVCRGVRGNGRSALKLRASLQPFCELVLACSGRGELKTLRKIEARSTPHHYSGKCLFAALYVNELLVNIARQVEHTPHFFLSYQKVLSQLAQIEMAGLVSSRQQSCIEMTLRNLEFSLLKEAGYAVDTVHAWPTLQPIAAEKLYFFSAGEGFIEVQGQTAGHTASEAMPGKFVLAISDEHFFDRNLRDFLSDDRASEKHREEVVAILVAAKRISRAALKSLVGERRLHSRALFV